MFLRGTLLLVAFGFTGVALARLLAGRLGLAGARRGDRRLAGRCGRGLATSARAAAGVGTVEQEGEGWARPRGEGGAQHRQGVGDAPDPVTQLERCAPQPRLRHIKQTLSERFDILLIQYRGRVRPQGEGGAQTDYGTSHRHCQRVSTYVLLKQYSVFGVTCHTLDSSGMIQDTFRFKKSVAQCF